MQEDFVLPPKKEDSPIVSTGRQPGKNASWRGRGNREQAGNDRVPGQFTPLGRGCVLVKNRNSSIDIH